MTTPSDALYAVLSERAPQTTRELTRTLTRAGHRLLLSSDIERLLLADPRVRHDGGRPLRWRALPIGRSAPLSGPPTPRQEPPAVLPRRSEDRGGLQVLDQRVVAAQVSPVAAFWDRAEPAAQEPAEAPAVRRPPLPPGSVPRYVGPRLRPWQENALDAWLAGRRRGIVQSIAAAGRTGVGVLAAWDGFTRGEKVLVLVPTPDAADLWFHALELQLPGLSLGRRGDGSTHSFDDCDVLVCLDTAARDDLLPPGRAGLLVADEVHRFGTPRLAATLLPTFDARLGLTAGLESRDPGADGALRNYFSALHDGCGLLRGRADGEIARFRLGLVPVELMPQERADYDALTLRIYQLGDRLVTLHGCGPRTVHDDAAALQDRWREQPEAATDASAYLRAVSERRLLAVASSAKLEVLPRLAPALAHHTRSLVFTHAARDAETAATILQDNGVDAEHFPTGRPRAARRATTRDLRTGELRTLTAHKPLADGTDLPAVTAVVLLASSTYPGRPLVERAGPALRPNRSDTVTTLLLVYARGTVEDPAHGHLADLVATATESRTFTPDFDDAVVAAWSVGL